MFRSRAGVWTTPAQELDAAVERARLIRVSRTGTGRGSGVQGLLEGGVAGDDLVNADQVQQTHDGLWAPAMRSHPERRSRAGGR